MKTKTDALFYQVSTPLLYSPHPRPRIFCVCAGLCFSSQVAAISSENKLSHERLTHLPLNCFFLYDVSPSGPNSIHRSENDSYQHILEVCQCAQRKRWTSDCSEWSLKYGFPVKGWLKGKQRIIRKLGDALAVVSVWGFFYITFSDKHQISRSLMTLLNCCVKFG